MKFPLGGPDTDLHEWHRWFAWHPVFDRWADTRATMIWLETIERRMVTDRGGFYYEYRPLSS